MWFLFQFYFSLLKAADDSIKRINKKIDALFINFADLRGETAMASTKASQEVGELRAMVGAPLAADVRALKEIAIKHQRLLEAADARREAAEALREVREGAKMRARADEEIVAEIARVVGRVFAL